MNIARLVLSEEVYSMQTEEFKAVQNSIQKVKALKKEQRLEEARALLEEQLQTYPHNHFLQASLADLYLRQNEVQQAERLINNILADNPTEYRGLMIKGDIAYRRRQYEEAISLYRQAYKSKEDPYLATRLIRALIRAGDMDEALSLCQQHLEQNPQRTAFKKLKASIYEKTGRQEEAKALYDEYLQDKPQDAFAYKEQIKLKLQGKSPQEAVRELRHLLKVGGRWQNPNLYTLLAGQLEKMGAHEEALEEYKKALELDPEDLFARKQMGFCLMRLERQEAIPYLEEAFSSDPSDYYIRSSLLSLYNRENLQERGMDFFVDIIRKHPEHKNLWGIVKKLEKGVSRE